MQPLAVFATITALYTSYASATCYSGGAYWGGKDNTAEANTQLIDACNKQLVGNYGPGESRKACRPSINNKDAGSYEFEIRNQNAGPVYISLDFCVKDTRREIYNCDFGGYEVLEGVYVRYVDALNFLWVAGLLLITYVGVIRTQGAVSVRIHTPCDRTEVCGIGTSQAKGVKVVQKR